MNKLINALSIVSLAAVILVAPSSFAVTVKPVVVRKPAPLPAPKPVVSIAKVAPPKLIGPPKPAAPSKPLQSSCIVELAKSKNKVPPAGCLQFHDGD